MKVDRRRSDTLVLDEALGSNDRNSIIEIASEVTFEEQQLGPRVMGRARERAVIESPDLANILWSALQDPVGAVSDWIPTDPPTGSQPMTSWSAIGFNPRSSRRRSDSVLGAGRGTAELGGRYSL